MTKEVWAPFDLDGYVQEVTSGRECFICRLVRDPDPENPIIVRDERHIAFLNRWPTLRGYTLVAPIEHREHAISDFTPGEFLTLQALIHRLGVAIQSVLPVERLYVLSLGSQAGNRHVHWHIAPLPPGVPYADQQFAALMPERRGYLSMTPEEKAALAAQIAAALAPREGDEV